MNATLLPTPSCQLSRLSSSLALHCAVDVVKTARPIYRIDVFQRTAECKIRGKTRVNTSVRADSGQEKESLS